MTLLHRRAFGMASLAIVLSVIAPGARQAPSPAAPRPATDVSLPTLSEDDARAWLTYLSSDALQGREIFTEGYGLAASYVAAQLQQMGVKPLGDNGTFLQGVVQRDYDVVPNSTVTVEVNGETQTFRDGEHVTFPRRSGGKQTLVFDGMEVMGYGQAAPQAGRPAGDFTGHDVKGKLVMYLPGGRVAPVRSRAEADRGAQIITSQGAAAAVVFEPARVPVETASTPAAEPPAPQGRGGRGARGRGGSGGPVDFTTVERVDARTPPNFSADEMFFEAVFSGSGTTFAAWRAKADRGETLTPFSISKVRITINVDSTYNVVNTRFTENVVGMVEGRDPALRDTYVFFGAHLDHVGYARGTESKGVVNVPVEQDRIWNGADDDGSGSTALLGMAKAFATGPKPRRSVVFIWHAGEEAGLLGSKYMADHPVVPLERVQAELNVDMIGRNRDDKASEANTVYVIGADRISTDLHNLMVATNQALPRPLTLNYEFNEPGDVNDFYTRSDHYSYALKGIPIAFFFTGTHADYHANTDSVDKILFPKLIRVAQLIYEMGFSLANSDSSLVRDNLGPRSGKGFSGFLPAPRR